MATVSPLTLALFHADASTPRKLRQSRLRLMRLERKYGASVEFPAFRELYVSMLAEAAKRQEGGEG